MPSTDNLNFDPAFKLGEISGKLDLLLAEQRGHQKRTDDRFDEVESDVQGLKRDKAWVLGGAAAVSLAASILLPILEKLGR